MTRRKKRLKKFKIPACKRGFFCRLMGMAKVNLALDAVLKAISGNFFPQFLPVIGAFLQVDFAVERKRLRVVACDKVHHFALVGRTHI